MTPVDEFIASFGSISRRSLLVSAVGAGLAACAVHHDPARLSFWAMSTEGENAPLLVPRFTKETGIEADVQALPWTAAHEKILTAFAGGSLPDVLAVANFWLPELTMLGALAPLPAIEAVPGHDLFPAVRASVMVDGRARAVPWVVDTQVQFFRRDLVNIAGYATPPADWANWKAMAHAIKRRAPDRFAVLLPLDWPEQLLTFAAQQPDPLLRDHNSRGNFGSTGFRSALAFYKSMFDEGLAPPILGTEVGDSIASFHTGYYALLPSNLYTVGDLRKLATLSSKSWGVAPMPGPGGIAAGVIGGSSLVVPRSTRDPARAWRFVRYLTRGDTQLRFNAITGDAPSRVSAWSTPRLAADPTTATITGQLTRGTVPPAIPEWQRIITEVQLVAEQTVRGQFTVAEAAVEIDRRVDLILAKRRWLLARGLVR